MRTSDWHVDNWAHGNNFQSKSNQISIIIPPRTTNLLGGGVGGHSVRLSVRPSVRPASRVRSVAPTVLVGSISKFVTLTLSGLDLGSDVNH